MEPPTSFNRKATTTFTEEHIPADNVTWVLKKPFTEDMKGYLEHRGYSSTKSETMSQTEQKYYTPKSGEAPNPLNLDQQQTEYAKDLMALGGDNGIIEMKLEQSVVMERLSKDIYKDFRAGFRELFANAVSACTLAAQLFDAQPRIEITLNPKTRELTIGEYDSLGMSAEVFKEVYTVVGRSGNFDGTRPGQFGFGRLAWITLSDRMILETKYRTTDGKTGEYAVQGQNATSFAVLPKPSLRTFGTTVKLIIYDKIDLFQLVNYIDRVCEFSKVDTFLTLLSRVAKHSADYDNEDIDEDDDDTEFDDDEDYTNNAPDSLKAGRTKINKTYRESLTKRLDKGTIIAKEYLLTGKGWELYGAFVGETKDGILQLDFSSYSPQTPTLLVGIPIEPKLELPFHFAVLNILDEREHPPTADRDRLKDTTVNTLKKDVDKKLRETFATIGATNLNDFMKLNDTDKLVFANSDVRELLPEAAAQISLIVEDEVYYKNANINKYNKPSINTTVGEFISKYSPPKSKLLLEFSRFITIHDETILHYDSNAVIINCCSNRRVYDALLEVGGQSAKNFYKKIPKSAKSISGSKPKIYSYESAANLSGNTLPKTAIKIPPRRGGLNWYRPLLVKLPTKYSFVGTHKAYANQGTMLNEFIASVAKNPIHTSDGLKTINTLPQNVNFIACDKNMPNPIWFLDHEKSLLVIDTYDRVFEAMVYLTATSKISMRRFSVIDDASWLVRRYIKDRKLLSIIRDNVYYKYDPEEMLTLLAVWFSVKDKKLLPVLLNDLDNDHLTAILNVESIVDPETVKKLYQ